MSWRLDDRPSMLFEATPASISAIFSQAVFSPVFGRSSSLYFFRLLLSSASASPFDAFGKSL